MRSRNQKTGVLLVNLGTPDAPSTGAVRNYLREFLMDPRVLDINPIGRWFLVNTIIAIFRAPKSARAYRQIWTKRGSPLLTSGQNLTQKVQDQLGEDFVVTLGMRYGNPSIGKALESLQEEDLKHLIAIPLFPQYSSAANGSAMQKIMEEASQYWNIGSIHIMGEFFDNPRFIASLATVTAKHLKEFQPDHLLMSYHGLPERHVQKSWEPNFHGCALKGPCPTIQKGNRRCYRAQCYETSRLLADELQLAEESYSVSFQSRLGRIPWIKPYTDEILEDLVKQGVKRLAVICPAFVADCLETLEEIGIRARQNWKDLGGEELHLIPCINDEQIWVKALSTMITDQTTSPSRVS